MKKFVILLLLLSGCSTTQFQMIDNGEPVGGVGGIIHSTINGVTVFSDGLPSGTLCHQLGIIDDSRGGGMFGESAESTAATEAAKYGANVISKVSESTEYDWAAIAQAQAAQSQPIINNNITVERPQFNGSVDGYSSYGQIMAAQNTGGCNGIDCITNPLAYRPTYKSRFFAFYCE